MAADLTRTTLKRVLEHDVRGIDGVALGDEGQQDRGVEQPSALVLEPGMEAGVNVDPRTRPGIEQDGLRAIERLHPQGAEAQGEGVVGMTMGKHASKQVTLGQTQPRPRHHLVNGAERQGEAVDQVFGVRFGGHRDPQSHVVEACTFSPSRSP
ncbi:MAG: hypothetical protein R3B72_27700 [Polyangiaceae bacterium]